jgi:hypothetical protein
MPHDIIVTGIIHQAREGMPDVMGYALEDPVFGHSAHTSILTAMQDEEEEPSQLESASSQLPLVSLFEIVPGPLATERRTDGWIIAHASRKSAVFDSLLSNLDLRLP